MIFRNCKKALEVNLIFVKYAMNQNIRKTEAEYEFKANVFRET
jgi:hypothetical protein